LSSHKLSFTKVAEISDVPVGKMLKVKINQNEMLIANIDGTFYAMDNKCSYDQEDLINGALKGKILTCPKNKAEFDVTTGKNVKGPKMMLFRVKTDDLKSYEVKIEGNDILIHQASTWGM
jgi:3-phenylpropionate/trans-cinnamate dioxygenase ferredoxin component